MPQERLSGSGLAAAPADADPAAPGPQPSRMPAPAHQPPRAATAPRRLAMLLAVGAIAAALAYGALPPDSAPDVAEAITRSSAAPAAVPAPAPLTLVPPARAPFAREAAADPFVAPSFLPPPPPPPPPPKVEVPPPPPPPTAPPLPFSFVGMLEKGSVKPAAFIAKGDALFVVSAGDLIEGTYRVESLNAAEIVLTYLPLGQRQSLAVSAAPR